MASDVSSAVALNGASMLSVLLHFPPQFAEACLRVDCLQRSARSHCDKMTGGDEQSSIRRPPKGTTVLYLAARVSGSELYRKSKTRRQCRFAWHVNSSIPDASITIILLARGASTACVNPPFPYALEPSAD